jgi:hypothetical protein
MRSKTLNLVLLVVVVLLDAAVLFFWPLPWVRLILGLVLLGLVIHLASSLGFAGLLGHRPLAEPGRRHYSLLRNTTSDLLAEVRRLNWLVVDLDRGFRDPDTVQAAIESSEQNLQGILRRIRSNAGKSDQVFDVYPDDDGTPPGNTPGEPRPSE